MHQRSALLRLALAASSLTACAETAPPPAPPEEIVVVLNTTGATLSLVPVTAPTQISTVPVGASDVMPVSVATRGATAVVSLRARSALAVVDLREQQLVNTIKLQPGSILAGAALINDSIAYVANSNLNTITRVDLVTGDTASLAVGNTPELASFGGFGFGPGDLTADGGDRLLISSRTEGLMEFDTAERAIIRGEGNGIPIPANTGVAVGSEGRVYALESGCSETGVLHILRPDFTEIRTVPVGQCASQILLARVPPAGVETTDDTPL